MEKDAKISGRKMKRRNRNIRRYVDLYKVCAYAIFLPPCLFYSDYNNSYCRLFIFVAFRAPGLRISESIGTQGLSYNRKMIHMNGKGQGYQSIDSTRPTKSSCNFPQGHRQVDNEGKLTSLVLFFKPETLGTDFKCMMCSGTGMFLFWDIQR